MREVITGRSVLSMPNKLGGFRLRYGRACNTGFAAVGIHPALGEILNHTIVVGTQIKIDIPGKGATVAFVDSIDTPIVRLKNGNVVKISNVKYGLQIKNEIEKILQKIYRIHSWWSIHFWITPRISAYDQYLNLCFP